MKRLFILCISVFLLLIVGFAVNVGATVNCGAMYQCYCDTSLWYCWNWYTESEFEYHNYTGWAWYQYRLKFDTTNSRLNVYNINYPYQYLGYLPIVFDYTSSSSDYLLGRFTNISFKVYGLDSHWYNGFAQFSIEDYYSPYSNRYDFSMANINTTERLHNW